MIDKKRLDCALRQMGRAHVRGPYRDAWTPERPTTGYCYVVAEVVYHLLAPEGSRPFRVNTSPGKTHWFIKDPQGNIIDPTSDQFDEPLDYAQAIPASFLRSKELLSKRGMILARLLGLV